MTTKVENRQICGHPASVGNTKYTCSLLKGHDWLHYDSFVAYDDTGKHHPVDERVKKARAEAERAHVEEVTAAAPAPSVLVHAVDGAGVVTESRRVPISSRTINRRGGAQPSTFLPSDSYPPVEGNDGPAKLLQGVAVTVKLRNIIAFDHKNPRQLPLVEEARRLMAANQATTEHPTFRDLIERVSDLYSSIPSCGLLEPIIVERLSDEQYELKAGWRRMTAMLLLFGEDCETVATTSAVAKDKAQLAALAENVSRRDMPWHMQAASFSELQKVFTTKELSDATGVSISQINNLTRIRNRLHPSIWVVVCKWGGTPKEMKMQPMLKLVAKEHEEQLVTWNLWTEGGGSKSNGGAAGPATRPVIDPSDLLVLREPQVTVRPMLEKEMADFLAVLRQAHSTHDAWPKDLETLRAMRFALGAVEAILGHQSSHVEVLRQALAGARTLSETMAKEGQAKGAKATTPSTITKRGPQTPQGKKQSATKSERANSRSSANAAAKKSAQLSLPTKKGAKAGKGAR